MDLRHCAREVSPEGDDGPAASRSSTSEAPGGSGTGEIAVQVPGRHNLQNALAAVAVGLELGLPSDRIRQALAEFRGAERRYQVREKRGGAARWTWTTGKYHPTEVAAGALAARVLASASG